MRILVIGEEHEETDQLVRSLSRQYPTALVDELESVGGLLLKGANGQLHVDALDLVVMEHHLPLGEVGVPLAEIFPHEVGSGKWNDQKGGEVAVGFLRKIKYEGPILFYTYSLHCQIAEEVRRAQGVYYASKIVGREGLRDTLNQIFSKQLAR